MAHAGSWFGLPDFGITEAIGGALNKPKTAQGGSNLIGPAPQQQAAPQQKQVLSASAQGYGPATVAGPPAGYGGGGAISGGGGQAAPQGGGFSGGAPEIPQPQQGGIDFDALIAPALQGLDAAIQPLMDQNAADISGINTQKQSQINQTNQSINTQTGLIGQAKETQKGNERGAADEARRQYAEIQQGLQSRFGGTTGTGAFATEQAGTQTLRSIANIRQAAQTSLKNLDDKLLQVQEVGRMALQDIENDANDQIGKAKSNLDLQLADIRNQKGQLMARKAELAANAIQMYQQTVNQVNSANAQFKQQLYMQQQEAQQKLQGAVQRANGIAQAATPEELMSYVQSLQPLISAGFSPTINTKLPGGGSLSLSRTKDDGLSNPFLDEEQTQ